MAEFCFVGKVVSILGRKHTADSLVFTRNVSDIFWVFFEYFTQPL